MEDKSKICPLCDGPVRYYYINFTELLFMCGIIYCEYPFGYEELKIITKEQWIKENAENPIMCPVGDIKAEYSAGLLSKANLKLAVECGKIFKLIKKLENKSLKNHKNMERNLERIKKLNYKVNLLKFKEGIIKNDQLVKTGGAFEVQPVDNLVMNTKCID